MHPVAAALLRGLGGVAKRAVNRAAASVAEDIGELAQGISKKAHDVVVNARCACDCTKCRQARKYRQIHTHCENCGINKV